MPPSPATSPEFQPSHWAPLVISLVGVVCTIFLLFCYYRMLKGQCCVSRVMISRSGDQRRHLNGDNTDDPSLQFQSHGLDSYIIHSLPITQFKKKNAEELCQSNTDCAICLGEFDESEWIKHLPNCSHVFHVSCIDTWFQTHSSCPLCRSHIYDLKIHHECSISMYTLLETLEERFLSRNISTLPSSQLPSPIEFSTWTRPENAN
ncbi:unnamed protein product [Ilex paraguariensis]|uniref:RING-type E3 ubiquitin transferase n=1 Tax=Ilex paraguariensis TaxID=185542 RepID=A0ABC8THI5_9AQUA